MLSEIADTCGLHSPKTDSLINSLSVRPDDERRIEAFKRFNCQKIEEFRERGIPFQPSGEDADISGDVILGNEILTGKPIGIYLPEFLRQGVIYGATGFYKSTTLLNIAAQVICKGIPVIIIDRKGRQFRSLQKAFPGKVLVLKTDGQYPFNPFSTPKGVSRSGYIPGVIEIRSAVFERHDSTSLFKEVLGDELAKFGNDEAPCEQALHNAVISTRIKKGFSDLSRFRVSLVNVSSGMVDSDFGKTLAFRKDLDLAEAREQGISLAIETPNLSLTQLEYLVSITMHRLNAILRSGYMAKDELKVLLIIDEASELLRERQGIPPIIDLSTKIRQAGIGLIAGMHAPHLAHSMFRTNNYFVCCYRIFSNDAVRVVRNTQFLNDEQAEYISKQEIKKGTITLGARHANAIAFLANDPLTPFDLNVSEEEVETENSKIWNKLSKPIAWQGELLRMTEEGWQDDFETVFKETAASGITQNEGAFLDYILHRFDLPLTEVYKELGFSMQEGNNVSNSVIKNNLATPVWLNSAGGKGSLCKHLVHTQKYFTISNKERPLPALSGTDAKGPEHFLMLRFILKNLETKQCSEVKASRAFENAVCDVYFRFKGLSYIAEVCSTTIKTEKGKIERILKSSDVEFAFVVVKDKKILKVVQKEFEDCDSKDRVFICPLSEFLNSDIETLTNKNKGA